MTINIIQNLGSNENNNLHERKKYDKLMGNGTKGEALLKLDQISKTGLTP